MKFKDAVVVVTGAGRGIGFEIVEGFASEGASCVLIDIDEKAASEAAAKLRNVKTAAYGADVTDLPRMEEIAAEIVRDFEKVDVLVNNAGITRDNLILRMKEDEWDAVLNVNLKGSFVCTKAFSRYMLKKRSGRIINISSVIGLMGNAGQANYSASKAGLIGLTKSSAKEFASRGVTVNAVAPGYIQTAMTESLSEEMRTAMLATIPLGREGIPRDVMNAVTFLASEGAGYITGHVLQVDGGMVM
jgi:3-oxoacyl-[acyl-carrier protein] reductase